LDKLQNLRSNVLVDKWYIPVKSDEALGLCLASAIKLAQEGIENNFKKSIFCFCNIVFYVLRQT
jgi:hypothetical protein